MKQNKQTLCIVLAAGEGTRLRPLTLDKPKCMVEYKGKPILHHTIDTLQSLELNDILLIGGYKKEKLARKDVNHAFNPIYNKTNMVYTLFCAKNLLSSCQKDVIISYGDIVYRKEVIQKLVASPHDFSVVVDKKWQSLWESRMEDPLLDAETLKIGAEGNIIELGKKPSSLSEIEGQYIGLIKIKKEVLHKVIAFYGNLPTDKLYDGKDFNNMYMTSFIQQIIDNLMPVYPVFIVGGWTEIDTPEDLEINMI